MVRGAAQESSHFSDLPFFRMYLHQRNQSDQQKLLMKLDTGANVVRYVAPAFSKPSELNDAFSTDAVLQRSIFVRPSKIGHLKDNKRHWVAFQLHPTRNAKLCSEPVDLEIESRDEFRATGSSRRGQPSSRYGERTLQASVR